MLAISQAVLSTTHARPHKRSGPIAKALHTLQAVVHKQLPSTEHARPHAPSCACAHHPHLPTQITRSDTQMWRTVLKWIAFPGFLLTCGLLLTVPETRKPPAPPSPPAPAETSSSSSSNSNSSSSGANGNLSSMDSWDSGNGSGGAGSAALSLSSVDGSSSLTATSASTTTSSAAATAAAVETVGKPAGVILPEQAGWAGVMQLVQNSAFMSVTMAAALNDVASYALVAWQVRHCDGACSQRELGEECVVVAHVVGSVSWLHLECAAHPLGRGDSNTGHLGRMCISLLWDPNKGEIHFSWDETSVVVHDCGERSYPYLPCVYLRERAELLCFMAVSMPSGTTQSPSSSCGCFSSVCPASCRCVLSSCCVVHAPACFDRWLCVPMR
eukprot:1159494-Pelagomonas_calceolata.AAC.2